jgi:hypothetical protein
LALEGEQILTSHGQCAEGVLLAVLTVLCSSNAFAQSDDCKKFEFLGSYSLMHFDSATESNSANLTALLESKELLNGFNVCELQLPQIFDATCISSTA